MLPKKNRADRKDIEQIFKVGRFVNSPNLTLKFIKNHESFPPRISFLTPKTVSKKAVIRNLLRRRGYSALEKSFYKLPKGLLGVFVFKKYQDDILILEHEIKTILNKIY